MFKKLLDYVAKVDAGLIVQEPNIQNIDMNVCPDHDYCEYQDKLIEIKDYIESHVHGVTVHVSGGEKFITNNKEEYNRTPIIIRTFKNNELSDYNEVVIDSIYLDKKNCASSFYNDYIRFFIEGYRCIKTGTVSLWEQFIAKWIKNNHFNDIGYYYCENNQVYWFSQETLNREIIISDIEKEVLGITEMSLDPDDEFIDSLVIVCRNKQILLSYENYYILEKDVV